MGFSTAVAVLENIHLLTSKASPHRIVNPQPNPSFHNPLIPFPKFPVPLCMLFPRSDPQWTPGSNLSQRARQRCPHLRGSRAQKRGSIHLRPDRRSPCLEIFNPIRVKKRQKRTPSQTSTISKINNLPRSAPTEKSVLEIGDLEHKRRQKVSKITSLQPGRNS